MAEVQKREWEKYVDDATGAPYYYNTRTGESSWEEPEGFVEKEGAVEEDAPRDEEQEPSKPPRWRRFVDEKSGKPYYYDEANEVTQWDEPEGEIQDASDDDDEEEEEADEPEDQGQEQVQQEEQPVATTTSEADENVDESPQEPNQEDPDKEKKSLAESTTKESPTTTNWVKHMDKTTGKAYYHDTISNRTQWEEPEHFTEANPTATISADYLEYLHRSRAERLARVTQQALDPQGNLSRLNALLSKIDSNGAGAGEDVEVDAPEDIEQSLKERARAEWQQHLDPQSQRFYYHNVVTGVTQWQKPDAPVVSALADWVPPVTPEPTTSTNPQMMVSGQHYAATAKFNRVTGKFEKLGGDEYWQAMGVATDREGRQMSHFFDVQQLEKNREEAKRIKEDLKRRNIDWRKVAAEKKAKKQKRKNEWIYQD